MVLDGIQFHSIKELAQDPTFIKIKELSNDKETDALNKLQDELKVTKPQLLDYIENNFRDITDSNNTDLNSNQIEVDIGNVPMLCENKNSND